MVIAEGKVFLFATLSGYSLCVRRLQHGKADRITDDTVVVAVWVVAFVLDV
ncbi:MAG: hypothetical protein NWF09_01315 [Candidatus Bathyarchaeota archaeon]|nr:hypothetical protein [Candidatus Bathyarchaeota archaeon]